MLPYRVKGTVNSHTMRDEKTLHEEKGTVILSMNPDQEARAKWSRLLEPPTSDLKKDIAAGMTEAMKTIQDYAQELPSATPDRKSIIYSRVRVIQTLLTALLDAVVDGRSVQQRRDVLELLEDNPCQLSEQYLHTIRQLYGYPQDEESLTSEESYSESSLSVEVEREDNGESGCVNH
ncbi:hypothetical protein PoHVEF18_003072 [Penicillium ochrochloron]